MALALPSGVVVNNTSQLSSQDVGIKISQPGYNAISASPTQLIFDSSWPSVPSAFTLYLASGSSGTVAHNLGFAPFTRIYTIDNSGNLTAATVASVDATNVYIQESGFLATTTTNNYFIDCSNIDLSFDIDYPTLPTVSINSAYDNNFGIKVAKKGKSVTSKDPRDFILHSRYRSPLIQAVKTELTMPSANTVAAGGSGGYIAYINDSNTATWNYGLIKGNTTASNLGMPTNTYIYAPYYAQAYPRTFTDGITTYLQFLGVDNGATLVILRDPFFATTNVQAFY